MGNQTNPFALVRASDYTDAQINTLWVELGASVINAIIEPNSRVSKYILGGKGSGKTHLLRYLSYPVSRLRSPNFTGLQVVKKLNHLAVFMRATALDSARFESASEGGNKWQKLFGIYLELRLVEGLLDALCDIKQTSSDAEFDDAAFIRSLADTITAPEFVQLQSIEEFRLWLVDQRRVIDVAINNSAFTGTLDVRVPFSIGSLCLPIQKAISRWNPELSNIPLIYLVDEIENFSEPQQQVVNSLIRYGEGLATFRITGRLYARKTFATIGGEENREGAEFKTTNLDGVLKGYKNYPDFAQKFVQKRLGLDPSLSRSDLDIRSIFEDISSNDFFVESFRRLGLDESNLNFVVSFADTFAGSLGASRESDVPKVTCELLTHDLPVILKKLNILQFCKKHKKGCDAIQLASRIRDDSLALTEGRLKKGAYVNAFGHFKWDLFAQLCRDSKKIVGVPYAGFDTFVSMSSQNPRNLLIVLGRAYEIASFRELDFINGTPLSIEIQTEAAAEAARFMYERDTNYGSDSDLARKATERLAVVLRTARYSLNIPEVSPLAVSFSSADLSGSSRRVLDSALNYSLVFEVYEGRPDRNNDNLRIKIQLNPLLSPKWGLPIGRRGDLSLNTHLANCIFDPDMNSEFDAALRMLHHKWNNPFVSPKWSQYQDDMFEI